MNLLSVGVQAVIAGLPAFNAAAFNVQQRLNAINAATQQLATQSGTSWGTIGRVSLGTLGAVTAAAGLAVTAIGAIVPVVGKFASDYESKLLKVQVLSEAVATDITKLNDTIFRLGTTTPQNMGAVTDAAIELSKAGLSVNDQISGALKAVVDFTTASAGELGMAEAAITVAKGLSTFGLEGKDSERVTNALTAAAQKSVLSYKDLTRSFQQAANVSALMGNSIEDLSAILAVMGQAGLRGSDAGTSLKQMFIELLTPSKDAAEAMNKYGINLFDTAGKVRPLRDVIKGLEDAFGDQAVASGKLTEAERARTLALIFGSDAIRASIVSARFGVKAFDEMTAAINRTKATDIANLFMLPTNAQLDLLVNKLTAGATVLGGVFLDSIRNSVTQLNIFLSSISSTDIRVFGAMLFLVASKAVDAGASLYVLGRAAGSTVQPLLESKLAVIGLSLALGVLTGPILLTGIATSIGALTRLATVVQGASATMALFALFVQSGGVLSGLRLLSIAIGGASLAFTGLGAVLILLVTNFGGFRDSIIRIVGAAVISVTGSIGKLVASILNLGAVVLDVAGIVVSGFSYMQEKVTGTKTIIGSALGELGDRLKRAGDDTRAYSQSWVDSTGEAQQSIYDFTNSLISGESVVEGFGNSLNETMEAFRRESVLMIDAASYTDDYTGATNKLSSAVENEQKRIQALIESLKTGLAPTLGGTQPGSVPGAAEKAKTFLEALGVTVDQVRKLFDELGYSAGQSAGFMRLLGISAAESSPLLGSLGLTMEQGTQILVKLGFTVEEATEKIAALALKLEKTKTAFEETGASIEGARKLLETLGFSTDDAVSKLVGLGVDALDAAGGLHEIGLNSKQATDLLIAMGFGTDEARSKLEQLAATQLAKDAVEKAKDEYKKFRDEIINVANAIESALLPAINLIAGGGLADNQVTATRAFGTQLTASLLDELMKIGEFSPELAETITTLLTDLTTTTIQWQQVSASAVNSTNAFFAAVSALPVVANDTSNAIGAMQNSAGALEALLPKLTFEEREFAEATIKAWNALIQQAIAAGDDEKKLEAVRKAAELMKPAFDRVAATIDAATQKFDAMRASVSKLGFAMEDIMEAASTAARTFAAQMEFTAKTAENAARRAALAPFLADVERARIEEAAARGTTKDQRNILKAEVLKESGVKQVLDSVSGAKNAASFQGKEFTREDLLKEVLRFSGGSGFNLLQLFGEGTPGGLSNSSYEIIKALLGIATQAGAELGITRAELEELAKRLIPLINSGVQEFHSGGMVRGSNGQEVFAKLTAGEYVMTPTQVQAVESSIPRNFMAQMISAMKNTGNTSYVVNANYGNEQSPASIDMDLRAITAMTR